MQDHDCTFRKTLTICIGFEKTDDYLVFDRILSLNKWNGYEHRMDLYLPTISGTLNSKSYEQIRLNYCLGDCGGSFVTTIGISLVLAFKIGAVNDKVTTMKDHIPKIEGDVKQLEYDMRQLRIDVTGMHVKLDVL
jgi:hypothetical protein